MKPLSLLFIVSPLLLTSHIATAEPAANHSNYSVPVFHLLAPEPLLNKLQVSCWQPGHFQTCSPNSISVPFYQIVPGKYSAITIYSPAENNQPSQPICKVFAHDFSHLYLTTEVVDNVFDFPSHSGYSCQLIRDVTHQSIVYVAPTP